MKLLHPLLWRFAVKPLRQGLGPRGGEVSIQKEKRLLRDGCLMAHGYMNIWIRKVERAESARQKLAIDERVNRSPLVARLEQFRGLAAHRHIQFAAGRQHCVANLLELEAVDGEMRKEAVLRVSL